MYWSSYKDSGYHFRIQSSQFIRLLKNIRQDLQDCLDFFTLSRRKSERFIPLCGKTNNDLLGIILMLSKFTILISMIPFCLSSGKTKNIPGLDLALLKYVKYYVTQWHHLNCRKILCHARAGLFILSKRFFKAPLNGLPWPAIAP
jgi:hypothetical protein